MKSWIKGGLWGLVIDLIVLILSGVYFLFCFKGFGELPTYCSTINFLNYPEKILFFFNSLTLNLIFYIILGALIGLIIGRIKKKKKLKK